MADDLHHEVATDEVVIGRVLVARVLQADGDMRDDVLTDDGSGDQLDLPTAAGMLAIAQHILVCERD